MTTMLVLALCTMQDWTQWRGPNRDGVVPAAAAPSAWPAKLKPRWKVAAGSGYASPIAAQGALYVFARQGDAETLTRYSQVDGRTEWSGSYTAVFQKNSYAKDMSKGPFATPLLHGGRVYTLGVTAILTSWDAASGRVLWRKDFSSTVDTSKLFTGTASSPIFEAGSVIVTTGDDRASVMRAFDPATGAAKWSLPLTSGPGYASPVSFDGKLITLTSDSAIAVDPETGKLLWTFPWKDEWIENIVTPVRFGDLAIFSGVRKGTVALRIPRDAATPPRQVWANPDVAFYMSTPVLDGPYLYGLGSRKKGQYLCLDTRTGKTVWTTTGREAQQAAVLNAGPHIVWMTSDGDLVVSRKNTKMFEQVMRYAVSEDAPVWTQPLLLPGAGGGGHVVIKSDNALSLWSLN